MTLTISGEADASIVEGDLVDNIADITWSTLDDDANDGFDASESGGSDSDNATFSLGNIEKSILNTGINDASNDNAEVVTGEYVTYQLAVEIPQGTSALAEIEDTLDAGLVFDQANGVTVVPSSTNLSTTIAPGDFSGITSSYDAVGNVISIDLGDITNTAPAGTVETLTITYRVYVDNDLVNADIGATLNNAVDFKWDIDGDGSNDGPLDGTTEAVAPDVEVIGPELQITKDITTVPSDAGDVVTYEMVISHTAASQAAAFDATFTDTLPSEISGVSIVSAVDSGGAAVPGFTVSGNTVSHADYDLPLGETITLTVTGTVNTTASASTTVDNVATIDWDTLGDDSQGNQSVEDGGSANDNDSFVVASPTFDKLIAGTGISDATNDDTEVVAGEYISYDLVVTVPEGTTPMAQITDTLHSNLIFDSGYSIAATGSAGVSFTGPATSPTVSGSNVTFDLGTITNTNTDDAVPDTVTITYRVYADSDVARGDTLNNDATLIWDADNDGDNNDGDGVLNDTTDVNVITPSMQVDKSVTLMPSDIGDLIEYTMVIRHTDAGDAPADPSDTGAYDVTFTDVLPAGLINPSVVSAVDSSGTSVAGFGVSGNTVSHTGVDIPLGEFITLTVQAEAGAAIVEGDLVDNIADITWTTLDDDANDGFDAGESGGSDSDNATFSLGNIEKSILNTGISDASNDNAEVVTGEYVTYQLSVEIPQGTSALAEIEDTLDTGLVFDQANGVTVVPSSTNLSTTIAPGDFSSVTSSYDATGNVISIDLGDITNTAPAGTVETLTITYRVYVDNDMVNAGIGATLNNAVDFKWDIDGDGSNDGPLDGTTEAVAPDVEVIGPELQITKDVITVPSDAGDVVTYEMVISHTAASQAAAFDATFTDTLPSEISGVSIVSAVDSGGAAVPGFTVSGNTVSHADYDLPLGETITLTVTGTVNTTASASTTVDNVATIDWDTLGDDGQGNQSVEDGGSANDNDSFVVASPTFEKSIFSTGINANGNDNQEVVAGEYIEYRLAVVVPEGTTPMAQITDTLHADLLFDSSYTITAVGSSGVSFTGPATMPTVTGSDVTFDLGTITNTNTDDTVDDTVAILYRVYADSDVVLGATLNNDATLIWDADNDGDNNDNDGVLNDSVDVSVIAPQLVVDKQVSAIPSDIGDPVEYTIVIRHSDMSDAPLAPSGGSAFDVTFNDVLPAGITNVSIVSAVDSSGANVPGFTLSGNTVSHIGFDLDFNDMVVLTVSGVADSSLPEGDTIVNSAQVSWSTLDDESDDGIDSAESGGNGADEATFSLSDIEKSIVATGINDASNDDAEVVSGEYITYQLAVEVPHGLSALAEIEDTLDAGLIFDQAYGVNVVPSSANLSSSLPPGDFSATATSYDTASNIVSFNLGDINNSAAPGSIETLTLTYRVFVDNNAVTASTGSALNNAVDFKWDIDGDGSNDGPLDGTTESAAPEVIVIEPILEVSKQVIVAPVDAGDLVTYEMVIQHTDASSAGAFDASFSDTLPSEISNIVIDAVTDSAGSTVPGFSVTGNTVSNSDFDLAVGDTITLTVSGTLNTTASASTTVNNVADISWQTLGDSTQGKEAYENSGSDAANDEFTLASPQFEKRILDTGINDAGNGDTQVVAGEYVTYQLVVTVPEGTTPMVQVNDLLDPDLQFDPSFSITAETSPGVSITGPATTPVVGGNNVMFDLGTVTNLNTDNSVAENVTITYRVYADADTVTDAVLPNEATLIWDANNDGQNNTADDGVLTDDSLVTVVSPRLLVEKSVTQVPAEIGDPISYTFVIRHTEPADAPLQVSQTGAYDVSFNDDLPDGLINLNIDSATFSDGTVLSGFQLSGNTLSHPSFDLAFGDTVTVVVSGVIGPDMIEGDTIRNDAEISWTTLDASADDGFDTGEAMGYQSDSATFTLSDLSKTIVSTGITDAVNDDAAAVVGEFIDYQVVVEVPKGFSPQAEVFDILDPGLVFDEGQGVSAVVSSGNVVTTLAQSDFTGLNAVYDPLANTISVSLGDIQNNAPVGVVENITLNYRVYVASDSAVASTGTLLNNAVSFRWDIDGDGSNAGPNDGITRATADEIVVISPELLLDKSIVTVPGETGDEIVYQFQISHDASSTANAYNVTLSDAIPAGVSDLVILSATDAANMPVTGFTLSGNTLMYSGFNLTLGNTVTVTVSGVVNSSVDSGDTIDNTAAITWSSLDANNPADGADIIDPGLESVQTQDDSDQFSIADLHKSIISTGIDSDPNDNTHGVVGEFITYQLIVDVPQGNIAQAEIADTLDEGLVFDSLISVSSSSGLLSNDAGSDFSTVSSPQQGDTGRLVFSLGNVSNTDQDNDTTETLTLVYRVYVENSEAVSIGTALNNDAVLRWDIDGDGVADDVTTDQAPPVTVLQPVISVSKTSDDAMPHLGQVINYTVTVMNEPAEYGADAHDVSVVDVLPQNALFDPASVQINGIAVADVSNVTDLSSGNTLALSIDSVAYNTEVTISYQALLTDDTEAYGSTVDNTVSVEWTTLSDQDPQDGADNAERNSSDGLAANAGNSITLTAPDYRIEKSSSVSSSLSAGDSISYTLNVSNIGTHEGTGVVVTDQFPVQVLGEPESISSGGSFNPDTGLVTWLIPTLGIDEQVVLTVDASVSDPQSADTDGDLETADDSFTNVASVTDDGLHGGDPNQTDNTSQATNEVVAAPDYTIRKTNDITMAAPTQLITYTITANNVGTQAGTNVEVVDEFPVDILAIENADGGIVDQEAGTITWSIPLFTVGQIESFSVDAVVLPTANLDTADQLFTNTVSITDDGLNGMDPTPDNNQAAESDMLRAGAGEPLFLTALPEQSGQSEIISNVLRGTPTFYSSAASDNPNTARILTSEHLNGEDSDKRKIRTGENDLLNGGSLLDTFNTPPPPIDCDPGVVTYDYESDPDSLEFLEWLSPEELQEQGVELEDAATSDSEPEAIGQVRQDDVTGVVKELKPAQTLQQQIERESANLHSAGKQEILEAFKDAV